MRHGNTHSPPPVATEMLASWPTQASLFPDGEKDTEWTQPPEMEGGKGEGHRGKGLKTEITSTVGEFSKAVPKRHLFAPARSLGLLFNLLDVGREDPGFEVAAANTNEVVVWVPVD